MSMRQQFGGIRGRRLSRLLNAAGGSMAFVPFGAIMVLGGDAPTVAGRVDVPVAAAAITITSSAPVLPRRVFPDAATCSFFGYAPTLVVGQFFTPDQADITIESAAPVVPKAQSVAPIQADITALSSAPSLAIGQIARPSYVDVSAEGAAPSLSIGQIATPSSASISVASNAPIVDIDASAIVPVGSVNVTAESAAPTLAIGQIVAPSQGDITATGDAPALAIGQIPKPAQSDISAESSAPTLSVGQIAAPAQGDIATSGFAPSLSIGQIVRPAQVDVSAVSTAPSLSIGQILTPAQSDVSVSSNAPTIDTTAPGKTYDLGKWSSDSVAILPGASYAAPNGLFATEDRNDNFTFASSTSTLTLPGSDLADGYLMVAAFEFEDTSNGRHNPVGKIVQASGTGNFVGGEASGYNRDNSEDRSYVRTWAFVDSPSASSTYQFQWKRDNDAATGGTVRSEFQVIPLYYSNHGIYSSTTAALYGGTTPNQVTGWAAVDESDTAAIELATNQFTIKGDNKRYLILGSHMGDHGSQRTQRWAGLYTGGALIDAAKSVAYARAGNDEYAGGMFSWLVETSTTDVTYEFRKYRGDGVANGEGGANSDGTTGTLHNYTLVILELNDSAEVFQSVDGTGAQQLALTGPVDLNIARTGDISFNDSASWTRASDTAMNAVQTGDVLIGANVSVASYNVGTGTRWTAYSEVTINGTEQTDSFHGNYNRNNQGSQDTFGWSANLLGAHAVTAGDDVGVSVTELTGSEGGGGNQQSPANWVGFWGININTL